MVILPPRDAKHVRRSLVTLEAVLLGHENAARKSHIAM